MGRRPRRPTRGRLSLVLVDTSAWVEFLRGTGSPVHLHLTKLIEEEEIATTEVVVMETLAGARNPGHLQSLRRLLLRCRLIPVEGLADHEDAAAIYRRCRSSGEAVRSLTDCLIASVAIRSGVVLLHSHSDFAAIARHTSLQILPLK